LTSCSSLSVSTMDLNMRSSISIGTDPTTSYTSSLPTTSYTTSYTSSLPSPLPPTPPPTLLACPLPQKHHFLHYCTATARYFYGLNTYSAILLQKLNFLEAFLTFFASGSKISMIIYYFSKNNCPMFYHKGTMAQKQTFL
jgi:hypothetical protein